MRWKIGILIAVFLALPSGAATTKRNKAECEKIRTEIRKIESRMRSGYSGKQGEKLNEKLRKLKAKRFEVCS